MRIISEEYNVVKILNKKEIVIDFGANEGAKEGYKVRIIEDTQEVISPLTNENLGQFHIIKNELEIFSVYPLFSICRRVKEKNESIVSSLQLLRTTITYPDLNVKKTDGLPLSVSGNPIEIGDKVQIYY